MNVHDIQKRFGGWTSFALSGALIGVAIITLLIALSPNNNWLKAGVLAYEILP